jgi:guanylate kinase
MWITISGPSGAGKSTLLQELIARYGARALPSYTTRTARQTDEETGYYRFVTRSTFVAMREAGEFILEDEVGDHLYGTTTADLVVARESADLWVADFTASSVIEAYKNGFRPALAVVLYVTEQTAELRMRERGDSEVNISSRNARWALELCNSVEMAALHDNVAIYNANNSPSQLAAVLMNRLRLIGYIGSPSIGDAREVES